MRRQEKREKSVKNDNWFDVINDNNDNNITIIANETTPYTVHDGSRERRRHDDTNDPIGPTDRVHSDETVGTGTAAAAQGYRRRRRLRQRRGRERRPSERESDNTPGGHRLANVADRYYRARSTLTPLFGSRSTAGPLPDVVVIIVVLCSRL